jgi:hypothetical protein
MIFRRDFMNHIAALAAAGLCWPGKLRAEAKAGARVVSFNFPVPGFCAGSVIRPAGALHHDPIYVYRVEMPPDGS